MSNVNAEIKWQGNDNAWFSTNASTVYPANIQIFHTDGRYKFTDGVTTLGALSFLGGLSYTLTASEIGSVINSANSATPNDTDLVMSVDTSVAKKNTWTQIKTFLKTYFDTVYATITDLTGYVKKGTLTTNTIPKATSSDTIGDSNIKDNGTKVNINSETSINGSFNAISNDGNSSIVVEDGDVYSQWTNGIISSYQNNDSNESSLNFNNRSVRITAIISAKEFSNDIFHSVKNMFSSPLHEFDNIVKLTGLTPSQIVETDASKNLVSAAKGTAYNKDFGTAAGNVLEGNRITQTITNGVTDKAPSEDAVFDALSLKLTQNNFTDITGSCTIVGWASYTTNSIRAVDMGDYYIVTGYIVGTSNSATTTVQMPYTNNGHRQCYSGYGVNNFTSIFTRVLINGASDTIDFKTGAAGNFWAATGTKEITFNLIIEK